MNAGNFEENVPISARSGIKGISNLEAQKGLGLAKSAIVNIGSLLQDDDHLMDKNSPN